MTYGFSFVKFIYSLDKYDMLPICEGTFLELFIVGLIQKKASDINEVEHALVLNLRNELVHNKGLKKKYTFTIDDLNNSLMNLLNDSSSDIIVYEIDELERIIRGEEGYDDKKYKFKKR